jgi:hypothetical protein
VYFWQSVWNLGRWSRKCIWNTDSGEDEWAAIMCWLVEDQVLTGGCIAGRVSPVVLQAAFARCGDMPQCGVPAMFTPWWLVTKWCPKNCWARFYDLAAPTSLLHYWWAGVARLREWGWRMMLIGEGAYGVVARSLGNYLTSHNSVSHRVYKN